MSSPSGRGVSKLSLVYLTFLLLVLAYGNAEKLHGQLLSLGEGLFTQYNLLRADPSKPSCDEESGAHVADGEESASPKAGAAADEEALLDELFGEEEVDEEAQREAEKRAREECALLWTHYRQTSARLTTSVKVYRSVEGAVAVLVAFTVDHLKHLLILLSLFGAWAAGSRGAHIALRPATRRGEKLLSELACALAMGLLLVSTLIHRQSFDAAAVEELQLSALWMVGFALLTGLHCWRARGAFSLSGEGGAGWRSAPLSVPLFAVMAIGGGSWFLLAGHPAGLAIELTKLTEHALLYLHVALYVWIGMLLKESPLATLSFDLVRPWRLTPPLLVVVVVLAAAIPTAYSGASGIFVIAVGALIYQELRAAGARGQLSLAATAMAGSMGVVLSPCLLVVIVASLNKQVTTDELFHAGLGVFLLSALLFSAAVFIRERPSTLVGATRAEGLEGSKRALQALAPYLVMALSLVLFYWLLLDATIDEHSAPMILPVILLALLFVAQRRGAKGTSGDPISASTAIRRATDEAAEHSGALLTLMGLSIGVGGVIQRAELMALFPAEFSTPLIAMSALVLILVIIGMTMDPYGAVILVSATIAQVAYESGISPTHFWMVVLVAFELGYLTPPVALNHLLTRQVVGEEAIQSALEEGAGWWARNERIWLPVLVMGVTLFIVAFLPLFW